MRSLPIPQLYRSLHLYLMQRIPDDCDSRLTNLIYLMMGLFQSRSVQLHLVARKTPIRAKKLSIVKRFERFLQNPAIRVRSWYHPFAHLLLQSAAQAGHIHLIIDASKVAFGFRLLMVSLAYQRRSLPIAWTWCAGSRGQSSTATQVKLLEYVYRLLPRQAQVTLVGDSEFGRPLLIENLRFWGWDYALRQPGDNLVMVRGTGQWQRLEPLPADEGATDLDGTGLVDLSESLSHPSAALLASWGGQALVSGDQFARPACRPALVPTAHVD